MSEKNKDTTSPEYLVEHDDDYVHIKRFDFSLKKVIDRYPDGAPNKVVAQALMISEEEAEELYQKVVEKLRKSMKVT